VASGGIPDLSRITSYCAEYPDRVCGMLRERNVDTTTPAPAWVRDTRIKAAVVAAPTLGFTLGKEALAPINVPLQLWRAGSDEITPHPRHAEAIYDALPTKPEHIVIPWGHLRGRRYPLVSRAGGVCRQRYASDPPKSGVAGLAGAPFGMRQHRVGTEPVAVQAPASVIGPGLTSRSDRLRARDTRTPAALSLHPKVRV
jgi:hypothetical protein